jgi:hypothetical protein
VPPTAGGPAPPTAGFRGLLSLPPRLAPDYTIEQELPAEGGQAVCLLVRNAEGTRRIVKLYHPGRPLDVEVVESIQRLTSPHVARIFDKGLASEPDSGGRDWELMEYVSGGTLRQVLDAPLPQDTVRAMLRQLQAGLTALRGAGIEHRDLKPENIMIRPTQPVTLVLIDFGLSMALPTTIGWSAGAGRSIHYAPPEAIEGRVAAGKCDPWSLGMIVVEALTGRNPLATVTEGAGNLDLAARRISGWFATATSMDSLAEGVTDPAWRKLARGLLRRGHAVRWGLEEIGLWLENPNHPKLVVAEEAARPAPGSGRPLRLLGEDVHTLDDLAALIERRWKDMDRAFGDAGDELRRWLTNQLGRPDLATRVEALRRTSSGKSTPDIQLFRIHREIAPARPPVFRDQPLTDLAIATLADRVATDPAAARMITELYDSEILLAQGAVPGHEVLGRIGRAWADALVAYESLRATADAAVLPPLTAARRTQLIATATPGSKAIMQLREEAAGAVDTRTRRLCPWYAKLGEPAKTDAASLIAQVLGADAAKAAVADLLAERSARAGSVAGNAFIGALMGGVIVAGTWWIRNRFCTDNCIALRWHDALGLTEQILAFGALGAAAFVPAVILTVLSKGGR